MKVRNPSLAVVGIAMLASAAALAAVLVHDGQATAAPSAAQEGDRVTLKGEPEPFHPDSLSAWATLRPHLANHTYVLEPEPGLMAIVTSSEPLPAGSLRIEGRILYSGAAPHAEHERLLIIEALDWRQPILFD